MSNGILYFHKDAGIGGTPWDIDIEWSPLMLINAASYTVWLKREFPLLSQMTVPPALCSPEEESKHAIAVGEAYSFVVRVLPGGILVHNFRHEEPGLVGFDGSVPIPVMFDRESKRVWMSLTPQEILSQREGIERACGDVLIGGLGLGWFASRVLRQPNVDSVTIVEKDRGVIETFGPWLPKTGVKCTIVQDDVRNVDAHKYESALYDIWMQYGEADRDDWFLQLQDNHPNCWGWR